MRRRPLQWPRLVVELLPALLLVASTTVSAQGPAIDIRFEASYAPKGFTYPGGVHLKNDHLEMPLLVRVSPTRARSVQPIALLGVAPAFELSCGGATRSPMPGGGSPLRPLDCSESRQTRYDSGYVGALGVDVPLRGGAFTVEVRYTHGAENLFPRLQRVRGYNGSVSVLVGVRSGGGR